VSAQGAWRTYSIASSARASSADIMAAYEHRYANVRAQPNVLLRDPTMLKHTARVD
jgi:hypothetical protein